MVSLQFLELLGEIALLQSSVTTQCNLLSIESLSSYQAEKVPKTSETIQSKNRLDLSVMNIFQLSKRLNRPLPSTFLSVFVTKAGLKHNFCSLASWMVVKLACHSRTHSLLPDNANSNVEKLGKVIVLQDQLWNLVIKLFVMFVGTVVIV